jgi:imidazolonepropionase-like amidohydrolase
MNRYLTVIFVLVGLSLPVRAGDDRPLALVHGVVLDGNGGKPVEDGVVVIRNGFVGAVGAFGSVEVPGGARVVDCRGKTVLPGLCDMHVHLNGGWDGGSMDLLNYRLYLNALLYAGVTTVLDTGDSPPFAIQLQREVEAGRLTGPRIFCAGPLIDGPDPVWPWIAYAVNSTEQIPKLVRDLDRLGVDLLKAYIGLGEAEMKALVAEGEKRALRVLVDQWEKNGSAELVDAGIAAFAHMPYRDLADEAVAKMKAKEVACITTLALYESFAHGRWKDPAFLDHPLLRDTSPRWAVEAWKARAGRPMTEADRKLAAVYGRVDDAKKNAKRLFDAGVLLVAGTDAIYPGVAMGEGLHRELELLVAAGLTPLQALTAATKNAGAFMMQDAEWGTLEPGRRADVLVVAGRPDRDIRHTRNVFMVIQAGRIVDRESLRLDPKKDPGYRPVRVAFSEGR